MEKDVVKLPLPPKLPMQPILRYYKDSKYKAEKEGKEPLTLKEARKEFKTLDKLKKERYEESYSTELTKYKKEVEDYNRTLQAKGYAIRAEYGQPEIQKALVIGGMSTEDFAPSKAVCELLGKYCGHALTNLVASVNAKDKLKIDADMVFEKMEGDNSFDLIKKSKYYKEVQAKLAEEKKLKEEMDKKRKEAKLKKEEEEKSGKSSDEVKEKKQGGKKKKSN